LKHVQKSPARYRKRKDIPSCPNCNKNLIPISYEEFIRLKEKALLNPKKSKF
jgi:hypothetical protein